MVFFDASEVTRAWITPENLKPYGANKKTLKHAVKNKKFRKRLEIAFKQADDADMLPLAERLAKYSFVARYKGPIGSPKKFTKQELKKYKNKLKWQFNVAFSDDDESVSDGNISDSNIMADSDRRRQEMKNKNVILVGTPKRMKRTSTTNKDSNDTDEIPINSPTKDKGTVSAVERADGIFKQPDSMTVQIGSTSINDTLAVDNG